MIDHRRKSLSDLRDVLGCQTRCGCIASREAWATCVPTDYFGIPHNTPSLAMKFSMSYSFQMQSGIWNNGFCFLAGNFFPTACTLLGYFKVTWHMTCTLLWLLQGHMTANNETVSCQNLWAGNIAKSMTSVGNSALLPANVDRQPQLFEDWSLRKQLISLPSNLNVSIGILGKQN